MQQNNFTINDPLRAVHLLTYGVEPGIELAKQDILEATNPKRKEHYQGILDSLLKDKEELEQFINKNSYK